MTTFELTGPHASEALIAGPDERIEVRFTVRNASDRYVNLGLRVAVVDDIGEELPNPPQARWFDVVASGDSFVAPGGEVSVVVVVTTPADAPEGQVRFRLFAFNSDLSDEDLTGSRALPVQVKLPPVDDGGGEPWWRKLPPWLSWAVAGAFAALAIGLALALGVGAKTYHLDFDGDGHPEPNSSLRAFSAPDRYIVTGAEDDCDDNDASRSPSVAELCDGIDQDCDGATPGETDTDGDGYKECEGDCAPENVGVHPGATEVRGDGIDQDCDGEDLPEIEVIYYADSDGDGIGDLDEPRTGQAEPPPGYVRAPAVTDCDDEDAARFPGNVEACDGVDGDCSSPESAEAPDEVDADGDGWRVCAPEECDDTDPAVHAGATDTPGDGIDQDCDGEDPFLETCRLIENSLYPNTCTGNCRPNSECIATRMGSAYLGLGTEPKACGCRR